MSRPAALTPQASLAFCADHAGFEGRLTSSKTSTTAISRTTTGDVYGYISKVVDDWGGCTNTFRYDGLAWARADGNGHWDWGKLIDTSAPACNWVIGSTDYLKANSTTDCPDTDAEYAMPIHLGYNNDTDMYEATYHQDINHDGVGDFMFIHSDCTSEYGAEKVVANADFGSGTVGNRPGVNCSARIIDGTNTTQSIVVDKTKPVFAFTAPAGAAGTVATPAPASYTVQFGATDNVAKFGSGHQWTLQRELADNTASGTCTGWATDTATGNKVVGSTDGAGQT